MFQIKKCEAASKVDPSTLYSLATTDGDFRRLLNTGTWLFSPESSPGLAMGNSTPLRLDSRYVDTHGRGGGNVSSYKNLVCLPLPPFYSSPTKGKSIPSPRAILGGTTNFEAFFPPSGKKSAPICDYTYQFPLHP